MSTSFSERSGKLWDVVPLRIERDPARNALGLPNLVQVLERP